MSTTISWNKIFSCSTITGLECYSDETQQQVPVTRINTTSEVVFSDGTVETRYYTVAVPAPGAIGSPSAPPAPASPAAPSTPSTALSTTSDSSAVASAAQAGASTATPSGTASNSKNSGKIAGAAVGCFITGALVVALVSFFLFKKRSQRNRYAARSTYLPGPEPRYGGEKGTPMVSVAPVGNLDFLPQQADDAEVQRKLSTVIDQIDQHVENFYSNRNIRLNANLEDELSRFETSELAQPLAACFEHTTNPTALIKHCLAFHIFNLTLAPGEGTQPLLPAELAGTIAAVYNKSLSPSTSNDLVAAFSSWKALTRYLRPDLTRDPTASRSTIDNTARIASHFTQVFSPWSSTQYSDEHRNRHLTELINHSVQTAIWLFGQPDAFRFDWATPAQDVRQSTAGRNANSVVIVPAVFKMTHNGARLGGGGQTVLKSVAQRF
ncbi:hypothetical protein LTR70_009696 [Exophiala xenobiotica]|uniref:Uncharacterized protein n=1 Tax=Lithohypha guttulata TaxID=1690604 RepID=A0ABR0JXA0_9EURO|nr:hypothetical protein LTR24_009583 [Lithohypha guttulata]KAK5310136.1 hypothetical protein LTR70_009696 [Exophiala xenobiotica]